MASVPPDLTFMFQSGIRREGERMKGFPLASSYLLILEEEVFLGLR
jgi:hypothetical protein